MGHYHALKIQLFGNRRRSLTLKAHAKGSFVVDSTSGVICQLPRITKESCLNKEGTTTGANFVGNVTYSRMF